MAGERKAAKSGGLASSVVKPSPFKVGGEGSIPGWGS